MKKNFYLILLFVILLFGNCSFTKMQNDDQELDQTIYELYHYYEKALNPNLNDLSRDNLSKDLSKFLKEVDEMYNSNLSGTFNTQLSDDRSRFSSSHPQPLLSNLPIERDGAIYLSGGVKDIFGSIITFISPKSTKGAYYHGAILDIDKYDPANPNCQCFQTAGKKGAIYETPLDWMSNINVAVFYSKIKLSQNSLNESQKKFNYYCQDSNKNMKYGFFKNYANIFSPVTKYDNYYWYCTKVVWRVLNEIGINVDSNSSKVDWTTSGLYSLVKGYYNTRYFFNHTKAIDKTTNYINYMKKTIVLADEIYYSPLLNKVYEIIR